MGNHSSEHVSFPLHREDDIYGPETQTMTGELVAGLAWHSSCLIQSSCRWGAARAAGWEKIHSYWGLVSLWILQTYSRTDPWTAFRMRMPVPTIGWPVYYKSDLPSHESHLNHNLAQPIHPYRCVTLHQCLYVLCLHRRKLLHTRPLYWADEFPKTVSGALRWCTYRSFINWTYGVLGTRVRRVISYCTVRAIQEIFPLEALGEQFERFYWDEE